MARTKSKKRLVGTWSTQQRREAMEQSREAARGPVDLPFLLLTLLLTAMGMVMVLSASFPPPTMKTTATARTTSSARAFSLCWAWPPCSASAK